MTGWSGTLIGSAVVLAVCLILYLVTRRYLVAGARVLVRRTD